MNEEDTKLYRCGIPGGGSSLRGEQSAAAFGWNKQYVGLHALRQLPVGGTCTDDDGDTWERVQ